MTPLGAPGLQRVAVLRFDLALVQLEIAHQLRRISLGGFALRATALTLEKPTFGGQSSFQAPRPGTPKDEPLISQDPPVEKSRRRSSEWPAVEPD